MIATLLLVMSWPDACVRIVGAICLAAIIIYFIRKG